jgi:hypothetical protein
MQRNANILGQKNILENRLGEEMKTFRGLTKRQLEAFEMIAINKFPFGFSNKTIRVLLNKGLIVKIHGVSCKPPIPIDYHVPLYIHQEWCEWCSNKRQKIMNRGKLRGIQDD